MIILFISVCLWIQRSGFEPGSEHFAVMGLYISTIASSHFGNATLLDKTLKSRSTLFDHLDCQI